MSETTESERAVTTNRGSLALWLCLAIGIGLALAPVMFQMFTRAPAGGDMIDDFAPYMTSGEIVQFEEYMRQIDAANTESAVLLRDDLDTFGAVDGSEVDTQLAAVVKLNDSWVSIDEDMSDLLARMDANLDNYSAVAALPPFDLFPWFFVLPGVIIAGLAAWSLRAARRGDEPDRLLRALAVVGIGVALAPVAFQMFSRAPAGAEMIDDFRPMMTRERVLDVQGYFVTMGAAEGQLRIDAVPMAEQAGGVDGGERYPAITELSDNWPTIVGDFSPMVATMSDNVASFNGIDALPPFDLFPWFFVAPGILVAVLAVFAARRPGAPTAAQQPAIGGNTEPARSGAAASPSSTATT